VKSEGHLSSSNLSVTEGGRDHRRLGPSIIVLLVAADLSLRYPAWQGCSHVRLSGIIPGHVTAMHDVRPPQPAQTQASDLQGWRARNANSKGGPPLQLARPHSIPFLSGCRARNANSKALSHANINKVGLARIPSLLWLQSASIIWEDNEICKENLSWALKYNPESGNQTGNYSQ
jgi:hypothetical protein